MWGHPKPRAVCLFLFCHKSVSHASLSVILSGARAVGCLTMLFPGHNRATWETPSDAQHLCLGSCPAGQKLQTQSWCLNWNFESCAQISDTHVQFESTFTSSSDTEKAQPTQLSNFCLENWCPTHLSWTQIWNLSLSSLLGHGHRHRFQSLVRIHVCLGHKIWTWIWNSCLMTAKSITWNSLVSTLERAASGNTGFKNQKLVSMRVEIDGTWERNYEFPTFQWVWCFHLKFFDRNPVFVVGKGRNKWTAVLLRESIQFNLGPRSYHLPIHTGQLSPFRCYSSFFQFPKKILKK